MDVDFGVIIQDYGADRGEHHSERLQCAGSNINAEMTIVGDPLMKLISTSHIERLNGTTRLYTPFDTTHLCIQQKAGKLRGGCSVTLRVLQLGTHAAILKTTPAMAAGVERSFWTVTI
jgi:hypothetical protein